MRIHSLRNLILVCLAATSGGAWAAVHSFTNLATNGTQAGLPAVTGSGSASATLDDVSGLLNYSVSWSGLTAGNTAMHFHGPAAPGNAAGVVVGITAPNTVSGSTTGSTTLSAGQVTDFLAGLYYYNVHTPINGGGEIRGQMIEDYCSLQTVAFTGNPATDFTTTSISSSNGSVSYYFTWDNTNMYIGSVGFSGAPSQPTLFYLDADPVLGSRGSTSGSSTSQNYDGRIALLPFTANLVVYFKDGYAEYRNNDLGTWSSNTVISSRVTTTTTNIEISVPWSACPEGVRPARFRYLFFKENGGGGTDGYAFAPTPGNTDGQNVNTSGVNGFFTGDASRPFLSASATGTFVFSSGTTITVTNAGSLGGTFTQSRALTGATGNTFSGTATSQDNSIITPTGVASDRYWTIGYTGSAGTSLNYKVSLDLTGSPGLGNLNQLVILKRNGGAWSPFNSTRSGNALSAAGLSSFSDFDIGFGTVSGVENWKDYSSAK